MCSTNKDSSSSSSQYFCKIKTIFVTPHKEKWNQSNKISELPQGVKCVNGAVGDLNTGPFRLLNCANFKLFLNSSPKGQLWDAQNGGHFGRTIQKSVHFGIQPSSIQMLVQFDYSTLNQIPTVKRMKELFKNNKNRPNKNKSCEWEMINVTDINRTGLERLIPSAELYFYNSAKIFPRRSNTIAPNLHNADCFDVIPSLSTRYSCFNPQITNL